MKGRLHSKMNKQVMLDYSFIMINAYSELMSDEISDKVRMLRFDALKSLQNRLAVYQKNGYMARLIHAIAEKRCSMIMEATTKKEMEQILSLSCPYYDGKKFITGRYHVPEEELICWSETSLRGPLNETGFKRYQEVFTMIFPEHSKRNVQNICASNIPLEAA